MKGKDYVFTVEDKVACGRTAKKLHQCTEEDYTEFYKWLKELDKDDSSKDEDKDTKSKEPAKLEEAETR